MAERLHPGVYVEDGPAGPRPIEGVSTSTGGFIGETSRGVPNTPHLVTSFGDYQRVLGGHSAGALGFMPQAVEAFFDAGGRRAYVVRALPGDAVTGITSTSNTRFSPGAGTRPSSIRFEARGPGAWSTALRISLSDGTNFPDRAFRIEVSWVEAGASRTLEVFDDVRMDSEHEDYFVDVVNETSHYIRAVDVFAQQAAETNAAVVYIPEATARQRARVLGGGETYRVYEGASFLVRWEDTATTDAAREDTIEFTAANVGALAGAPVFVNGATDLTAAQLHELLTAELNANFRLPALVDSGNAPEIQAAVATHGSIVIDAFAGTWNMTGRTLTLTVDGVGVAIDVDAELGAGPAGAVSEAQLETLLADAAGVGTTVRRTSTDAIIIATAPSAAGLAPSLVADVPIPDLTITATAGAAGALTDDLDGIAMTISEVLTPGIAPVVRGLGFPSRSRGYQENSPAHPDARPVDTTTPLRVEGGTDGTGAVTATDFAGDAMLRTGLHAFDEVDVNLLVLPGRNSVDFINQGMTYCDNRNNCFYVVDGPGAADDDFSVHPLDAKQFVDALPNRSNNAALFYPWVEVADPIGVGRNPRRMVPPSGVVAGIFARTDASRGVWKAPAGLEAKVNNALALQYNVVDGEQDVLNPSSVDVLRQFPGTGIVVWGSRTLSSDPQWRYVPVRRTALFIKESLRRGLQFAVFEPNDEDLWGRIRTSIFSFMLGMFRQGAFQGPTPDDAFSVLCDRSTNPQELIDQGIVTAKVAFAPLKPAEFVVIEVSQKTLLT